MPSPLGLSAIADLVLEDPGLRANVSAADITDGAEAAVVMNAVLRQAMAATGVNADGLLDEKDVERMSDYIRANAALYADFVVGHGDDEGNVETGFHLVQGDGGAFEFQGRNFVDTVADAIYHIGFAYEDGRFRNEDGDENEEVTDVAGWLNYFVNGENRVYGSDAAETLKSGDYSFALAAAADEIFSAGAGDDKIWAGLGADTVLGEDGNDRAGGGDGDDLMRGGAGNDSLSGEDGQDKVYGGTGDDQLSGGDGRDRLFGQSGDDQLGGGAGNDTLRGNQGADSVWGEDGNDRLHGNGGNDRMGGGAGQDTLDGGTGNDSLWGGDDIDEITGGRGADQLDGNAGNDTLRGNQGDDVVAGSEGHDRLYGQTGNDTLYGGAGRDKQSGGKGDDRLYGEAGHDKLAGQSGNDQISGGAGRDQLKGGKGADTLTGGEGRDIYHGGRGVDLMQDWEDSDSRDLFVFGTRDSGVGAGQRDVIKGFDSGVDQIDLSAFGGLTLQFGSQFSGTGTAEVLFDDGLVRIDRDGNGQADAEIELSWVSALSAGDFIL